MLGIRRYKTTALDLFLGDITEYVCDAMVNAANSQLMGGGGVDGAIHRAGGPSILEECRKIGGCPTGHAVVTTAGKLPAQWVIHAVGPIWEGGEGSEREQLFSAYSQSLQRGHEKEIRHIAFPSISTGVHGYPIEQAAKTAFEAIKNFLDADPDTSLKRISFVLFDKNHYTIFQNELFGHFEDEADS